MNDSGGWTLVYWPLLLSMIPLAVYIGVKCLEDVEALRDTNMKRGEAFFRRTWLAPDFMMLAMGLLISSEGLNSILKGKKVETFLGNAFDHYFWMLLGFFVVALIAIVFLWLYTGNEGKTYPVVSKSVKRLSSDGSFRDCEVYKLRVLSGMFTTRVGFYNIVIGNCLGILAIMTYAVFIFQAFVRKQ